MTASDILFKVTVGSRDNGSTFTDTTRINVIKELLAGSKYQLLHEGPLSLIYGKKSVKGESAVLISSHIDTVYEKVFCEDAGEGYLRGTFDNSLTNACVLYDMLSDELGDNVIVAFTGDEEVSAGGAIEVKRVLAEWEVGIDMVMVLDVTNEGWEEECPFTLENDLCIDIVTGYRIIESLRQFNSRFKFVHDAEPDESWEYYKDVVPCFTLCIPVSGDMHSESGALMRKASLPTYSSVLKLLANLF